jgi:hypothetical protein
MRKFFRRSRHREATMHLSEQTNDSLTELVITPEMIEAGLYDAKGHTLGAPLAELVRAVFVAMITEQRISQPR